MNNVKIMSHCDLVDFTQWCRSNGVPLLWNYDGARRRHYWGSKAVINTYLTRVTGSYTHIIRDSDFEFVKLRLGKVYRVAKSGD